MKKSYDNQSLTQFPSGLKGSKYEELSFRQNPIRSLKTLPSLKFLKHLCLDKTDLTSFIGCEVQPSLVSVSFLETPLNNSQFKCIMARIAFGDSLTKVNGRELTELQTSDADSFSSYIRASIVDGFVITSLEPIKMFNPMTRERLTLHFDYEDEEATEQESQPQAQSPTKSPQIMKLSKKFKASPKKKQIPAPPLRMDIDKQ